MQRVIADNSAGWLPLRHEDSNFDTSLRVVRGGCRVGGTDQGFGQGFDAYGRLQGETSVNGAKNTFGDILGWNLWDANTRSIPAWSLGWAVSVQSVDSGAGTVNVLPVWKADFSTDARFAEKVAYYDPALPVPATDQVGLVLSGTHEDAQQDLFVPLNYLGAAGGSGITEWYGDGSDGAFSLIANPPTTDPDFSTGLQVLLGQLDGRSGIAYPIGTTPSSKIAFWAKEDSGVWYYWPARSIFATTITIDSGVVLVPGINAICCSVSISGPGSVANDGSYSKYTIGLDGSVRTGPSNADLTGWIPGGSGSTVSTGGASHAGGNGASGASASDFAGGYGPPFDETSSVPDQYSGAGGDATSGATTYTGGAGKGAGYVGGHPMHSLPQVALGKGVVDSGVFWGGASGGGGANTYAGGTVNFGGNGGAGGAPVVIRAKQVGGSLAVSSNGADGSAASGSNVTDQAGGGGGGNPGWIVVLADSVDSSVTFTTDPGAGGAGKNGGQTGDPGQAVGAVFQLVPP